MIVLVSVLVSVVVISLVSLVVDAVVDDMAVWADVDSGVETNVLIVVEEVAVKEDVGEFVVIAANIHKKN